MKIIETDNRIRELLARFRYECEMAAEQGQQDIFVAAEGLLIPLFEVIFGYRNLENLNLIKPNFPAVDLASNDDGVTIQVTATKSNDKILHTLRMFVKHDLFIKYSELKIFILTGKEKSYPDTKYDEIIGGRFAFDKHRDIWDFTTLANYIGKLDSAQHEQVRQILESYFDDKLPKADTKKGKPLHFFPEEDSWDCFYIAGKKIDLWWKEDLPKILQRYKKGALTPRLDDILTILEISCSVDPALLKQDISDQKIYQDLDPVTKVKILAEFRGKNIGFAWPNINYWETNAKLTRLKKNSQEEFPYSGYPIRLEEWLHTPVLKNKIERYGESTPDLLWFTNTHEKAYLATMRHEYVIEDARPFSSSDNKVFLIGKKEDELDQYRYINPYIGWIQR